MSYGDEFSREKYAKSDITRGTVMLLIFILSVALSFVSGLLGYGFIWLGWVLLFMDLVISMIILSRVKYYTKRSTDYFIAFLLALFTFISFWVLSLNIP